MNYTFFCSIRSAGWVTGRFVLCHQLRCHVFSLLFTQLLNGKADHNKLNVIYGHHRIKRRQKWWQRVKAFFHSFLWQATGEQSNQMEGICDPAFNLFHKNIYLFGWIRQSMDYRRTQNGQITKKKEFPKFFMCSAKKTNNGHNQQTEFDSEIFAEAFFAVDFNCDNLWEGFWDHEKKELQREIILLHWMWWGESLSMNSLMHKFECSTNGTFSIFHLTMSLTFKFDKRIK